MSFPLDFQLQLAQRGRITGLEKHHPVMAALGHVNPRLTSSQTGERWGMARAIVHLRYLLGTNSK
jgi:hypothetical protein